MTLDQMTSQVATVFAAMEADKFKRKSTIESFATAAGIVTVGMSQTPTRSYSSAYGVSVKTQIKLDGKVIAKAALLMALGETSKVLENPVLKAAFMARAPELAADWADYVRRVYANVATDFPDGVPYWVASGTRHHSAINNILRDGCNSKEVTSLLGQKTYMLVLDEAYLTIKAKAYGDEAALNWFHKTNAKLGDVSGVEMGAPGSNMQVVAERSGKKIVLDQQRIINCSPKGKLFHQFPSRLYVEGKFTPESAYKKLFA